MDENPLPRGEVLELWLAELSKALDEALMLLNRLVAERVEHVEADLLRAQIEELRTELAMLRHRGLAQGNRRNAPESS